MRQTQIAACVYFALTASASAASFADLSEQFTRSLDSYLVDPADTESWITDYSAQLMDDLDGKWFPISILANGEPLDQEMVSRGCSDHRPHRIVVRDRFTIEISRTSSSGATFSTLFTPLVGDLFGVYSEPNALLAFMGIDPTDDKRAINVGMLLRGSNGLAVLRRPSPDILAISINYDKPMLYGRCPD